MMNEMRILSPTAILGYGFPEESFSRGLRQKPHVIAVDAGSTDPGPYYLGAGKPFVDARNVQRDLEFIIQAGLARKVPVLIGTAGGSGALVHVQACLGIIRQILKQKKKHATVGIVYADIPKAEVKKAIAQRRIRPLPFVPELTAKKTKDTGSIVAQMGVEPLLCMLEKNVDIVLAGRCYDPAVFAALPLQQGFDKGLALHLGKILECAAIAALPGSGRDCVLGILKKDSFILQPLSGQRRFTKDSVAAHSLYEKSNPVILHGPGGYLDLSGTTFRKKSNGRVEVRGSRFVPLRPYTLKLEGTCQAGFRTISICGIRDTVMIRKLDSVLDQIKKTAMENSASESNHLLFRVYGKNGVMGSMEPCKGTPGHEVGIVIEALSKTQQEANALCGFARSTLLHFGYKGRISTAGNLAFPFSPSDFSCGPVYEFSIYHLMEVEDPVKLFKTEIVRL